MIQELMLALIQFDTAWHNIAKNLLRLDQLIKQINQPVDLVLLPEMFATGFTTTPEKISDKEHTLVLQWMKDVAHNLNTIIAGSHPYPEKGCFYNRLFFYSPNGFLGHYDKRHTFTLAGEHHVNKPGSERKVIFVKDWKIFPLICYDLRFPVWSRNIEDYDLLVYSSNWPAARNSVWETLLKARAIENQCYVAGVNRTGTDGKGIRYIGNSQVISPKGDIMGKLGKKETVMPITLRKDILVKYRNKFPVLKDRDDFIIKI